MISGLLKKIFGSKNDRELKRLGKTVVQINALEPVMQALDDAALQSKTVEFKQRLEKGESLDQLLPEAFAVVREASHRVLGMRHFDVQLIGGMVLHEGTIAEMRTGEGKTLVATLPVYLNALTGKGVFVITVNDYLAERDAKWMAKLYSFLGLTTGVVVSGQESAVKKAAYNSDITYGTNNEFGFDYLRDNMAFRMEDRFQRSQYFAIVDEVDSILIDEARTPLIISGQAEGSPELYKRINVLIPPMVEAPFIEDKEEAARTKVDGHFTVDEKQRQIEMTEDGHLLVEELMIKEGLLKEGDSLYAASNLNLLHHVYSALRAHRLYNRDVEYIVQNGQIVLIDEHTGRTMAGRRLSEGLHQAIEAKEGVNIQAESQTLASTTFQNYFRLFEKLAGMTGTADTEAYEFNQIYGLNVVVMPTNKPVLRLDQNDLVFLSRAEKYDAIVADVKAIVAKGAPVLVGTASIDTSEEVSRRFQEAGIEHKVLNAKFHRNEAEIVAQAGRPGVVTVATNMAGRGTDIVLGGNVEGEITALVNSTPELVEELRAEWRKRHEQVLAAGGLHIIGTERHESRRIDNQLRGRSGRQGDPGYSRFYLSLEDNLMRIFASDRVKNIMQALGMQKGEAIEHRMVNNAIEKAQRKVESRNFDIRKQLLEYDDVANEQRQIIYRQRDDLLLSNDISPMLNDVRRDVVNAIINTAIPPQSMEEQWNIAELEARLTTEFSVQLPVQQWLDADKTLEEAVLRERIADAVDESYQAKIAPFGDDMRRLEKQIMLQVLDNLWKDHLQSMDHLRQGIHLRSYAQKNPKQEYKREAFQMFEELLDNLKHDVIRFLSHVEIRRQDEAEELERQRLEAESRQKIQYQHAEASVFGEESESGDSNSAPTGGATFVREAPKVGRNDPCPCGSGKKFKQCHGTLS